MDGGASIMHRVHGSSVDLAGSRAVVKMKATITQRFELPPNRFVLFTLEAILNASAVSWLTRNRIVGV